MTNTITYDTVKEIYARNYGSEKLYKRNYCCNLLYTEGIMDFQTTLNSFWVVDNIISYMPKIASAYDNNEFTFFVAEIVLNQNQQGYMEVFTEDYINGIYNDHISIVKQEIPLIDLPTNSNEEITTYKFFIELAAVEPTTFVLELTGEH